MLNISEYYSSAIKKEEKKWYMRVRFADSVNGLSSAYIDLDDYDIIEDSTSITSSATSNSYFSIGGVCAKELSLTLTAYGVVKLKEKSALKKGVCLSVDLWLKTDDPNQSDIDYSKNIDDTENTTGKVPMGIYYIYAIQNTDFQCQIKAYDAMLKFDVDISSNISSIFQNDSRTIIEWLALICDQVSTENDNILVDESLEEKIINKDVKIHVDNSGDLKTYRNALGYLSILAGGFIEITRDNKLTISYYKNESVLTVEHKNVVDYSFDDNIYHIYTVATSIAGFDYKYGVDPSEESDNKATLYLNENLFLRGIQDTAANELSSTIKSCIDNIGNLIFGFKFSGGSCEITNRPDLELGDNITINVRTVVTSIDRSQKIEDKVYSDVIVTKHIWNYASYSSITSNSYTEQTESGQGSSFKEYTGGTMGMIRYQGVKDVDLTSEEVRVGLIFFTLPTGVMPYLSVSISLYPSEHGVVKLGILYDGETVIHQPKFHVFSDEDTITFSRLFDSSEKDEVHSIALYLSYVGESGGSCKLPMYGLEATVIAWNSFNATPSWTGRYEIVEKISRIDYTDLISLRNMKDTLSLNVTYPQKSDLNDKVQRMDYDSFISLRNIVDNMSFGAYIDTTLFKILSTEFTITGSASVTEDTSTESGYYLRVGSYSSNIASFTFNVSEITDLVKIQCRCKGSYSKLTVMLDGKVISEDISINLSTYQLILLTELNGLSSGSHVFVLSSSGTSPYIDYLDIIVSTQSVFHKTHTVSTVDSDYELTYDVDSFSTENKRFSMNKLVQESSEYNESMIGDNYIYTIPINTNDFSNVDDIVLEVTEVD